MYRGCRYGRVQCVLWPERRELIQAVYDAAKRAGIARVYWHTHETNKTAMALYDKVAAKTGFLVYAKVLG